MKKINIVLFGTGKVGSTVINQVLSARDNLQKEEDLQLNIPVIANSTTAFFEKQTVNPSWETNFSAFGFPYRLSDVIAYVKQQEFENLVAIDATASESFVDHYELLIEEGFHIVAANKVANTLSSEFYEDLRKSLKKNRKLFFYETNVGAGLPIIQTLQGLHQAGEKITRVRGVFSGSLSYIFNTFSEENKSFSEVLTEAEEKGFTEPDPRVDLSGKDVGRKLLILARELKLRKELSEIKIEDLVPPHLNGKSSLKNFQLKKAELDGGLARLKRELDEDEVIRHVGELDVATGNLEVKLAKEKKTSAFRSLKNADSSFEIYTESYGSQPLVIRGAGAGAAVTARGVVSDILKLSERLN